MYQKSILITGGAGFIGSNFTIYLVKKYPQYYIINLDKLTYAGDVKNIECIKNYKNHQFIHGDICDESLLQSLFNKYNIKGVVHFAAESHVDNSITNPSIFIKNNIEGTFKLLEAARNFWTKEPFKFKDGYEDSRFHHISTDEVYGTLGDHGLFSESTPYAPNSPYSASKASSDFIVRSYNHTFGINTTISNCSNNYGPNQHLEKLIPAIIRNALDEKVIPIYGDGENIRDWLYVLDHCEAIDLIFHKGRPGETYNIGGNNEKTNLDVAYTICTHLDKIRPKSDGESYSKLINFVEDRPGHDKRYAIDATKIQEELSWKSTENFSTGILKTINWYLEKFK